MVAVLGVVQAIAPRAHVDAEQIYILETHFLGERQPGVNHRWVRVEKTVPFRFAKQRIGAVRRAEEENDVAEEVQDMGIDRRRCDQADGRQIELFPDQGDQGIDEDVFDFDLDIGRDAVDQQGPQRRPVGDNHRLVHVFADKGDAFVERGPRSDQEHRHVDLWVVWPPVDLRLARTERVIGVSKHDDFVVEKAQGRKHLAHFDVQRLHYLGFNRPVFEHEYPGSVHRWRIPVFDDVGNHPRKRLRVGVDGKRDPAVSRKHGIDEFPPVEDFEGMAQEIQALVDQDDEFGGAFPGQRLQVVTKSDSEHDQVIGFRAFGGVFEPDAFLGRAPVQGPQEAVGVLVVHARLRLGHHDSEPPLVELFHLFGGEIPRPAAIDRDAVDGHVGPAVPGIIVENQLG